MNVEEHVRVLAEDLIREPPVGPTAIPQLRERARARRRRNVALVVAPVAMAAVLGVLRLSSPSPEPLVVGTPTSTREPVPAPPTTADPDVRTMDLGPGHGRLVVRLPPGLVPIGPVSEFVRGHTLRSQPYQGSAWPSDERKMTVATLEGDGADRSFSRMGAHAGTRTIHRGPRTLIIERVIDRGTVAAWLADPSVVVEIYGEGIDEEQLLEVVDSAHLVP